MAMLNLNAAEAENRKRQVCIRRVSNLLSHLKEQGKEIYFEPLLEEVISVLKVGERTAKEYIRIGLAAAGLTKDDIQWYDRRFIKTNLNETQKILGAKL